MCFNAVSATFPLQIVVVAVFSATFVYNRQCVNVLLRLVNTKRNVNVANMIPVNNSVIRAVRFVNVNVSNEYVAIRCGCR